MDHSEWDFVGNICLDGNNCMLKPAWTSFEAIECINSNDLCVAASDMTKDECYEDQQKCSDDSDPCCNAVSWKERIYNYKIFYD